MNEQYSNTSPIAWLNSGPDGWCWKTSQESLLSEVPSLLERLPDWGTTAGGALFEQVTPEHLTNVRDGSVLPNLPTPRSFLQYTGTATLKPRQNMGDNRGPNLEEVIALLPTPRAQNGEPRNSKPWVRPLDQPQNLENAIGRLLPTPTARDYKDTGDLKKSVPDDDSRLPRAIAHHVISDPSPKQSDDGNESSDDPPPTPSTTGGTCRPCSSSG